MKRRWGSASSVSAMSVAAALVLVVLFTALVSAACGSQAKPEPTPTVAGTLAYTQMGGTHNQDDVYLIGTDGTAQTRLTDVHGCAEAPAWSPDGRTIALHRASGTVSLTQLWVMNADGSQARQLTSDGVGALQPAWSPDGKRIAFTSFFPPENASLPAHIYVIDADGSGRQQVTSGPACDLFADWAPDGRIFFLRKAAGWGSYDGDVYAVQPGGNGLTRVTTLGHVGGFALSPDGATLAIHDTDKNRIVLMPATGSGTPRTLVDDNFGYSFVQPSWSPDGRALALTHAPLALPGSFDTHFSTIHIVNADGSGLSEVPDVDQVVSVAWRPQ